MRRAIVSIFAALCWIAPANAESSLLDFSKPMTGKSRFVFNSDGTPVEFGAHAQTTPHAAPRSDTPAPEAQPASGVTVISTSSNGYSVGPTTMQVRGYTRRDGTYVSPYLRTAPYRP